MESAEQRKRVTPLSTLSLDSSTDDEEVAAASSTTRPGRCRYVWTPFLLLIGIVVVPVGLVLALDRNDGFQDGVDEAVATDSMFLTLSHVASDGKSLNAPQQKLMDWLTLARDTSEISVVGGSTNMSVTGVLFPQNVDSLLPFHALLSIDSGRSFPRRQYIVVAHERGYKWDLTSFGSDTLSTSGCLKANETLAFLNLDSRASWTSTDHNEVDVVFDGVTYTVSMDENDDYITSETGSEKCWVIESGNEEVGFHVCTEGAFSDHLSQADFEELFRVPTECPHLVPNASRLRTLSSVPLPLRKWYDTYRGED
ncbi:hypothetical protein PsorP6_014523 [Peronosclerospora sorghi]|uniref:Uncharacterized protein n=1 Tax=Peronosclerospora sorghi TaxID=230839 RepID=A0ACC0VUF7_9STRA|nr:hypothetical protein PsorP6_014523 [Peronosclerospora sorghi]